MKAQHVKRLLVIIAERTGCGKQKITKNRTDRQTDPRLEGSDMRKQKWYRKYRCRSCGAVCDPGELAGGLCFECRDAAERMEKRAGAAWSSGARISIREQPDGQMTLEVM